jgi:hypothetical protein
LHRFWSWFRVALCKICGVFQRARRILSPLRLPVPPRPRRCFLKGFRPGATNVFQVRASVFQNGAKPVHFASLTRVKARMTFASASTCRV